MKFLAMVWESVDEFVWMLTGLYWYEILWRLLAALVLFGVGVLVGRHLLLQMVAAL